MDPIDYLRALRRWWSVIVALTLVGSLAAFATSGGSSGSRYQATHILEQSGDTNDAVGLARSAFLATSGDVAKLVAKQLGEDPRGAVQVSAQADPTLNAVVITAVAGSSQRATTVADAFASALITTLDGRAQKAKQGAIDQQTAVIAQLQSELSAAASPSQASDLVGQISQAQSRLADIEVQVPSSAGLSTLQPAIASRTSGSTSRLSRVAIGTIMGFLLGLVVALVLARFDTRIRTKEAAEQAFAAPVLAEVPLLKRSLRSKKSIIAVADPESLSAEVYRGLRTALLVASNAAVWSGSEPTPRHGRGPESEKTRAEPLVVIVASPGMGEGKTTTSANLAVAFAESGRRVLILGCDLRRPEIHNYLGVSDTPGLTEELQKPSEEQSLADILQDTNIPGVRIAPSGDPVEHPGELPTRGLDLIGCARELADVVVIDTAPLLATDDASVLLPLADAVVVVCRSGVTSTEAATRARELLERLHAPLAGVVLIGAQQLPSARSYYRGDYRSRSRTGRTSPSTSQRQVDAPATRGREEIPTGATGELEIEPGIPDDRAGDRGDSVQDLEGTESSVERST